VETLIEKYEKIVERYPAYTYAEEEPVARLASQGDEQAFSDLVNHNAGRILFFARRAAHGTTGPESNVFDYTKNSISMDDAICVAMQSLMKSIMTFNPDRYGDVHKYKKVRFSSWANLLMKRDLISFGVKEHRRIAKESKFSIPENAATLIEPSPDVALAKERFWEIVEQLPKEYQVSVERCFEKPTQHTPKPSNKRLRALMLEFKKIASEEELRDLWRVIAQ